MRFIDEHRDRFAVALLLRVLNIAESTYYQWVRAAAGLTIASDAATTAAAAGLPPVKPAAALWAAMAERPAQNSGTVTWSAMPGRDWLGDQLWQETATIREKRGRVAQESVPADVVAAWARI